MKNIKINILLFLGLVVVTTSCSQDFLVENPQDGLTKENLFVNRDGLQQGINAIYALARQERTEKAGASMEVGVLWKTGTDTSWGNYTFAGLRAFDIYGTNLTAADQVLEAVFNLMYDVVNASNTIITRGENPSINWQGANEAENTTNKNLVLGQAHLLRAWAYRHLTNTWGNVPLNLIEVNGQNYKTYWPLVPVAEVRLQMEKDLLIAEQLLPDNYSNPNVLSKVVAQHYLAELYLTMGGAENYAKAEVKAEAAIANPNFKLITKRFGADIAKPGVPFMDQFNPANALPASGNTETLWSFLNANDLSGTEEVNMRRTYVNRFYDITTDDTWAFAQYGGRGLGRVNHTLYVEGLFESKDDRYSEYAISKYYLLKEGGTKVLTKVPTFAKWVGNDKYWPATKKWDSYPDLPRVDNAGQHNNMPYLRLAETYLLAAEAEFRLGKMGQAADHLNAIKTRSNATPILAAAVTVNAILDERARELMTEEHRRYVLNRFGVLVSRTKLYNKFSQIEDKNVLYPLPQSFVNSNDGPTPQPAGWEN